MKIIHIMGSSPSKHKLDIDIHTYDYDWNDRVAQQIIKYTSKYEIECWRPERTLRQTYVWEKDGITHRLFPSFYLPAPPVSTFEFSWPLLKELRRQKREHQILVHLYNVYNPTFYLLAHFLKGVPVVAHDFGEWWNSPGALFRSLVGYIPQQLAFRNIDRIFVFCEESRRLLARQVNRNRLEMLTMGVDFDYFSPMEKREARRRLNLPLDRRIILFVGHLDPLRGAPVIIKSFEQLKARGDTELICVGNHENDPFLGMAESAGARVRGFARDEEMPLYYNAADVYAVLPERKWLATTGLIAAIEALACNTPVVVSAPFGPFQPEEWSQLGEIPSSEATVAQSIARILDNPAGYKDCRPIAYKYYDWDKIVRRLVEVYDNLFAEYYSR